LAVTNSKSVDQGGVIKPVTNTICIRQRGEPRENSKKGGVGVQGGTTVRERRARKGLIKRRGNQRRSDLKLTGGATRGPKQNLE